MCERYAPFSSSARIDPALASSILFAFEMEKLVPPADHHNTTGEIDPSIHGHLGELQSLGRF